MGLVLLKILQNERNSISKLARKFGMLIVQPWLAMQKREKRRMSELLSYQFQYYKNLRRCNFFHPIMHCSKTTLTHFTPLFSFPTPWKLEKTSDSLIFWGDIECKNTSGMKRVNNIFGALKSDVNISRLSSPPFRHP